MNEHVEQLKHEIEELERQIAAHPFDNLFDRKRSDQLYHKLKKKRKELAAAEGVVSASPPELPFPEAESVAGGMKLPELHEEDLLALPPSLQKKTEPPPLPKPKPEPAPKPQHTAPKNKPAAAKAGSQSKGKAKVKPKPAAKAKSKPSKSKSASKSKPKSKTGAKAGKKKSR
jgi:hypothetical protein